MRKLALTVFVIFCCALLFGGRPAQEGPLPDRAIGGDRPLAPAPGAGDDAASAWTAIGPYGGEIRGLARNPKYPNELYASASAYPSQFYRSTNNSLTWTRTWICDSGINDIVTDPNNANLVYALTGYYISRSSDRGVTFPDSIPLPSSFRAYSGRMAIHPTNSKILYITGDFVTNYSTWTYCPAVAKSANGGQTWMIVKLDPAVQQGEILDIGIHPKNPNIIYLCGEYTKDGIRQARVYKSTNGGGSYKSVTKDAVFSPGGYNFPRALTMVFHPTDPNIVFIGHKGGVARTTNGGGSWQNQTSPAVSGSFGINAIAVDKSKPNTLYALCTNITQDYRGCWKSTDGGKTWTHYANGIYGYGTRLLVSGNTIIAGTWAGIFKSQNAGVLWKASHTGIKASRADSFGVAPSLAQTIYTEIGGYALFKTANGGGTWTKCPDFYRCESILGFVVHPSDPKKVFFLAGG